MITSVIACEKYTDALYGLVNQQEIYTIMHCFVAMFGVY